MEKNGQVSQDNTPEIRKTAAGEDTAKLNDDVTKQASDTARIELRKEN